MSCIRKWRNFAVRTVRNPTSSASSACCIDAVEWLDIPGNAFSDVGAMLEMIKKQAPSLVVSYRNLHTASWRWPFTLGSHLTALTQAIKAPVMVMPHPEGEQAAVHALKNTDSVMAITDHLTGDNKWADWYERVHQWAFDHFPDRQNGEWFGYLRRDGTVSSTVKSNYWKGPFHLPRMQLYGWQLLEEMIG